MCRQQSQQFTESLADIAHFLTLENSRSEISDALYVRALCQIGLQQNAEAIATLESIINDDPTYASMDKVLYELGWAHRNAGRLEQAQPYFDRLATDHAESSLAAESFYHLGERAYQEADFESAAQGMATTTFTIS